MPARKRNKEKMTTGTTLTLPSSPNLWPIEGLLGARALVETLYDPLRWRPVLVVSTASDTQRPRVNVDDLCERVGSDALVAVLGDMHTSRMLSDLVPEGQQCYGGAVRLYWPAASRSDDPNRHDLFLIMAEENGPGAINSIRRALTRKGFCESVTDTPSPSPAVMLDGDPYPEATAYPAPPGMDGPTRVSPPRTDGTEKVALLGLENSVLKRQVRSLTDQVAELERRLHGYGVFADPARQFQHEVWLAYLNSTTDADRTCWPLRDYTLGPDFLDSLNDLEGVERDKIVSCCVDVLSSRIWEGSARNPHQQRINEAGGSPAVTRPDGAVAWRCNLQTGTPSARRLMWWENTDGSVELGRVAIHDDMALR